MLTFAAGCGGGDEGNGEETSKTAEEEASHEIPHPNNNTLPEAEAKGETLSGAARTPGGQQAPDNPRVNLSSTSPAGTNTAGTAASMCPIKTEMDSGHASA